MSGSTRIIDVAGLDALVHELAVRGYTVVGPTLRDGAIVNAPITSAEQLPRGVGDEQGPGTYRTTTREDDAFFGFAAGAQSMKPVLFPANELLWRGKRDGQEFDVVDALEQGPPPNASGAAPYALFGVRGCDIAAILIQDHVLTGRPFKDEAYRARRAEAFIVSVTCGTPADTCFCTSMGTGPKPREGYDLNLTEVIDDDGHRFVIDVESERGAEVMDAVEAAVATPADETAATAVVGAAAAAITRTLDRTDLKDMMYGSAENPRWEEIASRCLSCTNCTLVCPTCFCTSVEDVGDLGATTAERHRVWDSCFSEDFSYIHGGSVREGGAARYRQWMTHKLGSWEDQFGMTGCVGCGRCITWCPVGIDITAEAAALRADAKAHPMAAQDKK